MKNDEILKIENIRIIYLHNEGLFWCAYEYLILIFE